jgi:tetratricopeptide (TPR) repeat protein
MKKLEEAEKLYRKGEYQKAYDLASPEDTTTLEEFGEACRIRAWALYYLAIKGDDKNKLSNARDAVVYAEDVIIYAEDNKQRLSAYNVLPLALWISGNEREAWMANDEALEEFYDEPSVWNTRSILARWAKDYEQGVIIGDRVTEIAVARGDFLTAGHGEQNKGDSLRVLGQISEACTAYRQALKQYRQHELITGNSATPHIASVEKKLAEIK